MESICSNCEQVFNQLERQAVILPCGDSICLNCFHKLLQPQDSKIECPAKDCGETFVITQKFKDRILKMRQAESGIWIMCDTHPHTQASMLCKQHLTLVCDRCVILNHADHISEILEAKNEVINIFCDKALGYLTRLRDNINQLCQSLQEYTQKDKGFSSQYFMELVNKVQKTLIQHLENEQERLDISFLETKLRQIVIVPLQNLVVQTLDFDQHSQQIFNINLESQQLLKEWIGKNVQHNIISIQQKIIYQMTIRFELLFRGTRDGFKIKNFFDICKGIGSTLTIIKSKYGQIFGGFISIPHQPNDKDVDLIDKDAFIFTLSKKKKFGQTGDKKEYAVRFDRDHFLKIGYGPAIFFKDDCNINKNSGSFFTEDKNNKTFQWPEGVVIGSVEGKKYLGGSQNFQVIEVETYKVNI